MSNSTGNWLIVIGIVIALVGLSTKAGLLDWFGHLPGDIVIKREGMRLYFPITSMILVSIALSLLLALVRRL